MTGCTPGNGDGKGKPCITEWAAVRWLVLFLGFAAINLFDPLGLVGNTERYSSDLANRYFSATSYDQTPTDPPVVLLWTQEDLRQRGLVWPVAYGEHARVLRMLREAGVRAIFMDIAFLGERAHMDHTGNCFDRQDPKEPADDTCLSLELERFAEPDAPQLFLADPAPFDATLASFENTFWDRDLTHVQAVAVPGGDFDRLGQIYPYVGSFKPFEADLFRPSDVAVRDKDVRARRQPTAACAVYESLYDKGPCWCWQRSGVLEPSAPAEEGTTNGGSCAGQPVRTWDLVGDPVLSPRGEMFEVRWRTHPGNDPAEPRTWQADRKCRRDMPRITDISGQALLAWTLAPVWRLFVSQDPVRPAELARDTLDYLERHPLVWLYRALTERQECPSFDTYHVWQLVDESRPGNTLERRRDVLAGRVVFVGVDLIGISDNVEPPTHMPLPGVFFHAAAFDTLVDSGGEPPRHAAAVPLPLVGTGPPGEPVFSLKDALTLAVLALMIALWVHAESEQRRLLTLARETPDDPQAIRTHYRDNLWAQGRLFLLAVALVALASAAALIWLNLAPVNFVGLLGLLLIGKFVNPPAVLPPRFAASEWPTPPPPKESEDVRSQSDPATRAERRPGIRNAAE